VKFLKAEVPSPTKVLINDPKLLPVPEEGDCGTGKVPDPDVPLLDVLVGFDGALDTALPPCPGE
jgi:hypothetical protein